ncbi:MAG: hypothetical protein H7195_00425, partial [Chryseobacterium sp.]|nr:hypothetical protein [Chryseobacterium sp.]
MAVEIKLDQQRETSKGFSIIIYINFKGKRKNIATKYSTFLKDWDQHKVEPKKSHPNYSELLNYLFEVKYRINQLGNLNNYSSIEKIKSELLNSNSDDLMTFWNTLVKEFEKNGLKKAEKYKSIHSVVSQFQSVILFDELDYNFLIRFRNFKLNNG